MSSSLGILLVAPEGPKRAELASLLRQTGFPVEASESVEAAKPGGPVGLLVLGDLTPAECEQHIVAMDQLDPHTFALVLTEAAGPEWNQCMTAADDLLVHPFEAKALLARAGKNLARYRTLCELADAKRDAEVMLELTQALASSLDFRDILLAVVRRIAEVVQVARASVVVTPEAGEDDIGYVVVASDDSQLTNMQLDLKKYPEIQAVLRSGESLTIEDATTHPVLDPVRSGFNAGALPALTLFPITWQDQAVGVLFLRAGAERGALDPRERQLCQMVANATAVALRNARVMQSLRDHTQKVTFARFEAEQRLEELHRYADLFASAAEGIAVINNRGRLLFANPRAFEILGGTPESMANIRVADLIHEDDRVRIASIWRGLSAGTFPRGVDVRLRMLGSGEWRICTVSFSSLAEAPDSVLTTFQDVTEQRRTEAELVKTMEFLESLIDASVDGIVAADMSGNLILFNQGAERIYGYQAEEVVGRLTTRELYPPGMAHDLMRRLRSADYGGVGRLAATNVTALGKNGERIPIRLSAAIIYEDGEPSATFGIFTDLREKIRVEERLAEAQEKLALSEKHSLVAELAGTAAHELNQPLTSVMAYAELLKRKLAEGTPEHRAATVMYREADRMADIVRKIGKMTKYETKSYVGEQRILDLEKASDDQ